jgi:hypothetical protein
MFCDCVSLGSATTRSGFREDQSALRRAIRSIDRHRSDEAPDKENDCHARWKVTGCDAGDHYAKQAG